MRSVVFMGILIASILICASLARTQKTDGIRGERLDTTLCTTGNVDRLARELSRARKSGNTVRTRELEQALLETSPSLPFDADTTPEAISSIGMPKGCSPSSWGHDVKILSGRISALGKRSIAIDADTLGGIYVGIDEQTSDSTWYMKIFRSTDGGNTWTFLDGWSAGMRPLQSLDICVTDSSDGISIIAYTFALNFDRGATQGGYLYAGTMWTDGSHHRYKVISYSTASRSYRNPTICTDGGRYAPGETYFYVAAEFITPSTGISRGLAVTRSSDWGATWSTLDTSICGNQEATPDIALDWSCEPDTLCIAFSRYAAPSRALAVARNSITFPKPWRITYPDAPKDDYDPSLAIDPVHGTAMISFTRDCGSSSSFTDAMCLYSTDHFETFKYDTISCQLVREQMTSVTFEPRGTGYSWHVAYWSSAYNDSIFCKTIDDKLSGFRSAKAYVISQVCPAEMIAPALGHVRSTSDPNFRVACAYSGIGQQDVYFASSNLTVAVLASPDIPDHWALAQNYPNPFNPETKIGFRVWGLGSRVKLSVFDILGREVAVVVDEQKEQGRFEVKFDGSTLSSGVYFYRLTSGKIVSTKKMLLLR